MGWIAGAVFCCPCPGQRAPILSATDWQAAEGHPIAFRLRQPAAGTDVRASANGAEWVLEFPQDALNRLILLTTLLIIICAMLAWHCSELLKWRHARAIAVPLLPQPMEPPSAEVLSVVRSVLLPRFSEWLNSAAVRRIISQRDAYAEVQALAEAELAKLEETLVAVHAPLQYRLEVYEQRVSELEEALKARSEENRAVIETMLEVTRKKLQGERKADSSLVGPAFSPQKAAL